MDSTGCCATPSTLRRGEAREHPRASSAPAALSARQTFSWADRRKIDAFGEALTLCGTDRARAYPTLLPQLYDLRGRRAGRSETRPGDGPKTPAQAGRGSPSRWDSPERHRPRGRGAGSTSSAATTQIVSASSSTSDGSAHCFTGTSRGSKPTSRCAAPRSASASATSPVLSSSSCPRMTRSRATPTPEHSPPGSRASENGSAKA